MNFRILPNALIIAGLAVTILLSGCRNGDQDGQSAAKQNSSQNQKSTAKRSGGLKSSGLKSGDLKKAIPSKKNNAETGPADFAFVWKKDSGIDFKHFSGFDGLRAFPAANGSGIGIIDFDRDGWEDLYFGSGKQFPLDNSDVDHPNQLYRNLTDWKFERVTLQSGVGHTGYTSGIAVGDYDNDGFQDVYVGCYGRNVLYRNQGDGSFEEVVGEGTPDGDPARPPGLDANIPDTPGWATSSAFFDYNNDGNLDLYVGNYGIWNLDLKNDCGDREQNEPRFCSPTSVRGQPDVLYENNGDGTFTDVSAAAGIYTFIKGKNNEKIQEDHRTQGVIATDFNQDGYLDLYCGNDMHPNLLLVNSADFKFENRTELSSTGYGPNGGSKASMGVAAGDVDNDGHLDLFCTNFSDELNSFYRGMGNLQFAEVARANRLGAGARPWVGWGTDFVDLDSDGWLDVIVTNGHVDPNIKFFEKGQQYLQPCLIWKNEQGRFRLARVKGEYFAENHAGRALAKADLDNDGDLDFVVGHQDRQPALLENVSRNSRVAGFPKTLIGTRSNRDGIGVRVSGSGDQDEISVILFGGGTYLSSHTNRFFESRIRKSTRLSWPAGGEERISESAWQVGSIFVESPR